MNTFPHSNKQTYSITIVQASIVNNKNTKQLVLVESSWKFEINCWIRNRLFGVFKINKLMFWKHYILIETERVLSIVRQDEAKLE